MNAMWQRCGVWLNARTGIANGGKTPVEPQQIDVAAGVTAIFGI
jgi:hypothetical protein